MAKKTKPRLSVFIPCYNEEENIAAVVGSIIDVVPKYCLNYEIIIINDTSKDKTGEIAERLSRRYKKLKVFHNKNNLGFGGSYWKGVEKTRFEYALMVWGDYGHSKKSLHDTLSKMGKYDVVIPNYTNLETRSWQRRLLSLTYTLVVNLITGFSIRYYNGAVLYRADLLKNLPRKSKGFGFQAEILAYVLNRGTSCIQIDTLRSNVPDGPTSAFKPKNIADVARSLWWLFWQFRILPYLRKIR